MKQVVFAARGEDSRGQFILGTLNQFGCATKVISNLNDERVFPLDVAFFTPKDLAPNNGSIPWHEKQWFRTVFPADVVPDWVKDSFLPIAVHPSRNIGDLNSRGRFKAAVREIAGEIERWFVGGCIGLPWDSSKRWPVMKSLLADFNRKNIEMDWRLTPQLHSSLADGKRPCDKKSQKSYGIMGGCAW